MPTLAEATLSDAERRAVDLAVERIKERIGDRLVSVWLYGSRARGEPPGPESDIDLLVITRGGHADLSLAIEAKFQAADESDFNPLTISTKVMDPEYLQDRREIEAFFIQEVDRDKIVLFGEP